MEPKLIENYIVTPYKLGEGSFGVVYRGYLKDDKAKILAVKQIELKNLKGGLALLKRELDVLNLLESPYIVKFYKPIRTVNNLYFFLEYCQTDLKKYMKSKKQGYLSEAEAISFLRNICQGFRVLQQNSVIHRDIKPANILIKNGVAKITDFGFARVVDNVDDKVAHTFLGSPLYMSPEILAKKEFSAKCDVWSLGMTFYEMLYGKTPWSAGNIPALLMNIKNQKLQFPAHPHRSAQTKELLQKMLAIDEEQRISWNDIYQHEFMIGIHSKKIQDKLNEMAFGELQNLEKAFTINQLYFNNNRVLSQAHHIESLDDSELPRANSEKDKEKIVSNSDHEADLMYQMMCQKEQNIIEKVDQYFRYRRNVLVYINITTNNFFSQCKDILPMSLFYMGVFMLQKYQVNGYNLLIDIFNGKKDLAMFSQLQWKLYKKSSYYWKTLKSFKTDDRYLTPFFKEVYKASIQYFDKNPIQEELLQIYNAFKTQHNEDPSNFDIKIYETVIEVILGKLKEIKGNTWLINSLWTCQIPFDCFNEQTDFYLLYEEQPQSDKKTVSTKQTK